MLPFLVYCLAVGAVAVPKINVVLALLCIQKRSKIDSPLHRSIRSDDICTDPVVHAEMGRFVGYGNLLSGILCAVSSPLLGRWSDRYGRKPFIAFSAIGMLSGDAVSLVAVLFPEKVPVYAILLEFVIGGLTGAFLSTVALMQAYATDITPLETRASVFSRLHACMYLGLALGPAAGAFLVRNIGKGDMVSVFYVAGVCHCTFILYILVGLPESLPARSILSAPSSAATRPSKHRSCAFFHGHNFASLSILGPSQDSSSKTRNNLPILATIDALSFGLQVGLPPLLVLFSEYQLHWKNFEASLFLSVTNVTRAMILVLVLPTAISFLRALSETPTGSPSSPSTTTKHSSPEATSLNVTIIRISLLLVSLSYLGFAIFSQHPLPFVLFGILSAANAPISPLAQSSMTNNVPADRTGELFGAVSMLHAVSRALLPALLQFVYSLTLRNAPEALFYGLSVLSGIAFLGAWRIHVAQGP